MNETEKLEALCETIMHLRDVRYSKVSTEGITHQDITATISACCKSIIQIAESMAKDNNRGSNEKSP